MPKVRIDVALTARGICESREKAKALISAGEVYINGNKALKANTGVEESDILEIKNRQKYVSRGGLKLEKAIELWNIGLDGAVCMDIGASTGGFTDCMLQNGAQKVYAVDVGADQLAQNLKNDSRVINMEKTNIRFLEPEQLDEQVDFCSIDVSFISLTLVLGSVKKLLKKDGKGICLVKPQFEAGREKVGKNGVVKDIKTHKEVLRKIYDFLIENAFFVIGATFSPIKGPQGNIEYLYYFTSEKPQSNIVFSEIEKIAEESHKLL